MRLFLLFDPDGDSRSILATYLRHLGHQVLDTDIPGDALALAREHRPDAVITEAVRMRSPTASLLESLRLDPATASIPVVVWTSRVDPETIRAVRTYGGIFVSKPAAPSVVYRSLTTALDAAPFDSYPSDTRSRPPASRE